MDIKLVGTWGDFGRIAGLEDVDLQMSSEFTRGERLHTRIYWCDLRYRTAVPVLFPPTLQHDAIAYSILQHAPLRSPQEPRIWGPEHLAD